MTQVLRWSTWRGAKVLRPTSGLFTGLLFSLPSPSYASAGTLTGMPLLDGILSTVIYGLIGVMMATLGYKVVDKLTPGCLSTDITKEKNVASAILAGAMILGICIIIGCVLIG